MNMTRDRFLEALNQVEQEAFNFGQISGMLSAGQPSELRAVADALRKLVLAREILEDMVFHSVEMDTSPAERLATEEPTLDDLIALLEDFRACPYGYNHPASNVDRNIAHHLHDRLLKLYRGSAG